MENVDYSGRNGCGDIAIFCLGESVAEPLECF